MNAATRLMVTVSLALASGYAAASDRFTQQFPLSSCTFVPFGGNAYFSLMPGRQLYYSNSACVAAGKCDELNELWITTEHDIKRIALPTDGNSSRPVFARVVEERETLKGELVEVSKNYFANCFPSRDVYYFGEDVDIYEGGEVVSHEGGWLAGRASGKRGRRRAFSGRATGSRGRQGRRAQSPGDLPDRGGRAEDASDDTDRHRERRLASRRPKDRFLRKRAESRLSYLAAGDGRGEASRDLA